MVGRLHNMSGEERLIQLPRRSTESVVCSLVVGSVSLFGSADKRLNVMNDAHCLPRKLGRGFIAFWQNLKWAKFYI